MPPLDACLVRSPCPPQGHRLKNMNCKLIRELKTLHAENKLLLTGRPLSACALLPAAAGRVQARPGAAAGAEAAWRGLRAG